jgi:hypothetical protein
VVRKLEEVFTLLQKLSTDPSKFVVRGYLSDQADEMRQHLITGETGYLVRRRTVRHHGIGGHLSEVSRQLQMLDLDGVRLPEDMSVVVDPEACVKWAVDHLLPSEFAEASFIYQLSASAGLTKLDNELNVHLWLFTNREYGNQETRTWAKWWNAKQQRKIVDPALFTEVQPHYTNEPELLEGLIDPLAGRRLALIRRRRRAVKLCMPTADEVTAELKVRRERAIKPYNRAGKTGTTRKSKTTQPEDDRETSPETETALESGADPFVGGPYFDTSTRSISAEGGVDTSWGSDSKVIFARRYGLQSPAISTNMDFVAIELSSALRSRRPSRRVLFSAAASLGRARGKTLSIISPRRLAKSQMLMR